MTRFIEIGSQEHQDRLAWRDTEYEYTQGLDWKYNDGQRYTQKSADILRAAAKEQRALHQSAIDAGGYENPFDLVDEALETDPVVVTHDFLALHYANAAAMIEWTLTTGIDITAGVEEVSALVDRALDQVGIRFDADIEPEGLYI